MTKRLGGFEGVPFEWAVVARCVVVVEGLAVVEVERMRRLDGGWSVGLSGSCDRDFIVCRGFVEPKIDECL